jgi:hypothetical protein
MDLIRDLLDKQLVDRGRVKFAKADGLVVELRAGQPPRLLYIEFGFVVLARRIGRRSERFVRYLATKIFKHRRHRPGRIPWGKVKEIGTEVLCDIRVRKSAQYYGQNWLRDAIIGHIPGARK